MASIKTAPFSTIPADRMRRRSFASSCGQLHCPSSSTLAPLPNHERTSFHLRRPCRRSASSDRCDLGRSEEANGPAPSVCRQSLEDETRLRATSARRSQVGQSERPHRRSTRLAREGCQHLREANDHVRQAVTRSPAGEAEEPRRGGKKHAARGVHSQVGWHGDNPQQAELVVGEQAVRRRRKACRPQGTCRGGLVGDPEQRRGRQQPGPRRVVDSPVSLGRDDTHPALLYVAVSTICDRGATSVRSSRPTPERLSRDPLTQGRAVTTPYTLCSGRKWPEVCRTCGQRIILPPAAPRASWSHRAPPAPPEAESRQAPPRRTSRRGRLRRRGRGAGLRTLRMVHRTREGSLDYSSTAAARTLSATSGNMDLSPFPKSCANVSPMFACAHAVVNGTH